MKRVALLAAALLMQSVGAAQTPGMQLAGSPPAAQIPANGTAVIRGSVVAAESGRPVRWATVTLSAPARRQTRTAITDDQGLYQFSGVPAGSYTVSASKQGYLSIAHGQRRPAEPGRPFDLVDKQVLEKLTLALPRGGAISGRLYDERGEAVVNLTVSALRRQFVNGRTEYRAAANPVTTNDLGEYRIYGLEPGRYVISATMRFPAGTTEAPSSGLAPTYFPGTTDAAQARVVDIHLGETVSNTDIEMTAVRTARLQGTVTDTEGRPLAGANLNLIRLGASNPQGVSFVTARPDGSFVFTAIPPGKYSIDATSLNTAIKLADEDTGLASLPVEVTGEDLSDLRLTTMRRSKATGRVIFDPAATPVSLAALRFGPVLMERVGGTTIGDDVRIADDLSFEIRTVHPGRSVFNGYRTMPAGWAIKSVRHRGVDVTDTGLDFKQGETTDGIEVELTNRLPTLQGTVRDAANRPVDDYTVLIFSQQPERWTDVRSRYFAIARPGPQGIFSSSSLVAGEYFVVALEYVDQFQAGDPQLLESLKERAVRTTLGYGDSKTVEIRLVQ